jgi:hypothetical protein
MRPLSRRPKATPPREEQASRRLRADQHTGEGGRAAPVEILVGKERAEGHAVRESLPSA